MKFSKQEKPTKPLKNKIMPNTNMTRYAVFDADAILFILSIPLPLHEMLEEAFGPRTKIVVAHSTIFNLRKRSQSNNKTRKEKAKFALWFIKEFDIPVKGYLKWTKAESYLKMGEKRNYRLITHNPRLVAFLHKNNIETHHIHPFRTTGYRYSKHQTGDIIGGLKATARKGDLMQRIANRKETRKQAVIRRIEKKKKRRALLKKLGFNIE